MSYVYLDRYGYAVEKISEEDLETRHGGSLDGFLRACENLALEVNLEHAVGSVEKVDDEFNFLVYNCAVAMKIAGAQCQCGEH